MATIYPVIDPGAWSARIARWNAETSRNYAVRRDAVERCRREGHDYRTSPVGVWCYRCCQYFRGEGE